MATNKCVYMRWFIIKLFRLKLLYIFLLLFLLAFFFLSSLYFYGLGHHRTPSNNHAKIFIENNCRFVCLQKFITHKKIHFLLCPRTLNIVCVWRHELFSAMFRFFFSCCHFRFCFHWICFIVKSCSSTALIAFPIDLVFWL